MRYAYTKGSKWSCQCCYTRCGQVAIEIKKKLKMGSWLLYWRVYLFLIPYFLYLCVCISDVMVCYQTKLAVRILHLLNRNLYEIAKFLANILLPSNIICKQHKLAFVYCTCCPPIVFSISLFSTYSVWFYFSIFLLLAFLLLLLVYYINSMEIPEMHTKWGSSLLQDVKLSAFLNFPSNSPQHTRYVIAHRH